MSDNRHTIPSHFVGGSALHTAFDTRAKPLARKRVRQIPSPSPKLAESSFDLMGSPKWFGRNEKVYGEREPADYVYLVMAGSIRTFRTLNDGCRQVAAFYLPGDFFGLEQHDEHSLSAEAITRSKVRVIKRKTLFARATENISIINRLLELTLLELKRTQDHNLLMLRSAQKRVVGFLLEIAEREQNQSEIVLPMPRRDIGDYLGLTVETVSRMLGRLESACAISTIKRRLVILRNFSMLEELNA